MPSQLLEKAFSERNKETKSYLNLRLINGFKEEKMLQDAFVSIDILHSELHSFLVGVWEFAEGALSLSGGQEDSSCEQQSKRQQTHLQPVWARSPAALTEKQPHSRKSALFLCRCWVTMCKMAVSEVKWIVGLFSCFYLLTRFSFLYIRRIIIKTCINKCNKVCVIYSVAN